MWQGNKFVNRNTFYITVLYMRNKLPSEHASKEQLVKT